MTGSENIGSHRTVMVPFVTCTNLRVDSTEVEGSVNGEASTVLGHNVPVGVDEVQSGKNAGNVVLPATTLNL